MKLFEKRVLDDVPAAEGRKSFKMNFRFLTAGAPTTNGRVYPRQVLAGAVARFADKLRNQPAFGGSRHPGREGLEVDEVSHMITGVRMSGDDALVDIRVLPTQKGRNLAAILKNGGRLGVSLRGNGEIRRDEESGLDVVQPGMDIAGVDFVMVPAAGCYVGEEAIFESASVDRFPEEAAKARYRQAVAAGFKGSYGDYRNKVLRCR